jgi:hypothetical protein
MKPEDYAPGPTIDTPELLLDVLANEDGVFHFGTFLTPAAAERRVASWKAMARVWIADGSFRRACLKCLQTGKEMRAAIRAPVVDKTYGKHKP